MHFNAVICKIAHLGTQKVGHTQDRKLLLGKPTSMKAFGVW